MIDLLPKVLENIFTFYFNSCFQRKMLDLRNIEAHLAKSPERTRAPLSISLPQY